MVASHRSAMSNGTWVIDSGASHNYGNNLRDFRKDSVIETNMIIKLGDKHQVQAKKKGVVRLGDVEIEAFFVPEFRISLLSVGQLDSYGCTSKFSSGICSITNTKGNKVLSAILEQGLYILSSDGSAHVSDDADSDELRDEIYEVDEMEETRDPSRQNTSPALTRSAEHHRRSLVFRTLAVTKKKSPSCLQQ